MGFGADIRSSEERDVGELLSEVQSHDLLKFGIIPELIGRLPVLTSLDSLKRDDLVRILTEPKNAMTKQYKTLLDYDGVQLEFEDDALGAIADRAIEMKIGARGLRSVMEKLMTDIMYTVPSDPSIEKVVVTGGLRAQRHGAAGDTPQQGRGERILKKFRRRVFRAPASSVIRHIILHRPFTPGRSVIYERS